MSTALDAGAESHRVQVMAWEVVTRWGAAPHRLMRFCQFCEIASESWWIGCAAHHHARAALPLVGGVSGTGEKFGAIAEVTLAVMPAGLCGKLTSFIDSRRAPFMDHIETMNRLPRSAAIQRRQEQQERVSPVILAETAITLA